MVSFVDASIRNCCGGSRRVISCTYPCITENPGAIEILLDNRIGKVEQCANAANRHGTGHPLENVPATVAPPLESTTVDSATKMTVIILAKRASLQ